MPLLATGDAATVVLDCVEWLDRQGMIDLYGSIVMPDHFHFIAALCEHPLERVMHSLKSFTAHRINNVLGRNGAVWQDGFHDHALHSDESVRDAMMYCLGNPIRKGLVEDFHDYPHWRCRWDV